MERREDTSPLRLKPLQVQGFSGAIDLVDGRLTIGRSDDNDLCLPGDVFPSVSTHHARLEMVDGSLVVEDLGSKNGTFLNGDRIERAEAASGDIVQLGSIGPRFVVVSVAPLSETMFVDPEKIGLPSRKDVVSETTVAAMVRHRTRRNLAIVGLLLAAVVTSLVIWGRQLSDRGERGREEIRGELADGRTETERELAHALEVIEQLRTDASRQEQEHRRSETDRQNRLTELEGELTLRQDESTALQARLVTLEQDNSSAEEIAALREQLLATQKELVEAREKVEMFDPVNLEQARLTGVSRVRSSIVLLEASITLVNTETDKVLHEAPPDDGSYPNFEDIGEPWTLETTGSGFCVSPEGWILTNAHVVMPPEDNDIIRASIGTPIEPRITVTAVFSGESQRRAVEIVKVADVVDVALVKIRPFDGMPHLSDFGIDSPVPETGTDLFLFGFPLGNFALQEGETVIASTFRGILSRVVDDTLQVDAGVHPGNSGGPITDARGRVIGIVFSVQALPDRTAVYTIGYGIPIADARPVWPPPEDWEEEAPPD